MPGKALRRPAVEVYPVTPERWRTAAAGAVCFFVAKPYRGTGIMALLPRATVDYALALRG